MPRVYTFKKEKNPLLDIYTHKSRKMVFFLYLVGLVIVANPVSLLIILNLVLGDTDNVPNEVSRELADKYTNYSIIMGAVWSVVQFLNITALGTTVAMFLVSGEVYYLYENVALAGLGSLCWALDIYLDNYQSSLRFRHLMPTRS